MLISRTTGIMLCQQTGGPITGLAYKREGLQAEFYNTRSLFFGFH